MGDPMVWILVAIGAALILLRFIVDRWVLGRVRADSFRSGYDRAVTHWVRRGTEQDPERAYAAGFREAQRRAADLIEADAGEEEWTFTHETVMAMLPGNRFVDEHGEDWTPFGEEEVGRG